MTEERAGLKRAAVARLSVFCIMQISVVRCCAMLRIATIFGLANDATYCYISVSSKCAGGGDVRSKMPSPSSEVYIPVHRLTRSLSILPKVPCSGLKVAGCVLGLEA